MAWLTYGQTAPNFPFWWTSWPRFNGSPSAHLVIWQLFVIGTVLHTVTVPAQSNFYCNILAEGVLKTTNLNWIVSNLWTWDAAVKGLLMKVLPAFVGHFEQMLWESSWRGAWRELGGVGHLPVLAGCHSTTLQPPPGRSSLKRIQKAVSKQCRCLLAVWSILEF